MILQVTKSILAAILSVAVSAGVSSAQTRVVVDVDAQPAQPPVLLPDELDQLVGSIALYPDPLIAQILPASTYPLDIVRAARLVRSGATSEQLDQQNWDPSVRAISHYPTVLELMDSNLDWTQQLGQAFVAQPDDVMQSIQRLRQKAHALGNLTSTPQAQVLLEENAIYIVPASPTLVYVPVYQPSIVYYEQPAYPCITFGVGFFLGAWFDLSCDWHYHYIYRPGWTWNHWHDNIDIDHDHIVRVHRPEFRHDERPSYAWHRDDKRPLYLPGRRATRPSDFDQFRGRDSHPGDQAKPVEPRRVETPRPVPDRGRDTKPAPPPPRSGLNPAPSGTDTQRSRDRGQQSLHPSPAPSAPPSQPAPAKRPAPTPSPMPSPTPTPRATPSAPHTAPARVPTPPVKVAPPPTPSRPSAPPFTGRPASPSPSSPSKDNHPRGRN